MVTGAAWFDCAGVLAELDPLAELVSLAVLDSPVALDLPVVLLGEELVVSCELAAGVLFAVPETAAALVEELLVFVESAGSCPEASCT